jgi:cytochrome c-type biogenesis protein CcmH
MKLRFKWASMALIIKLFLTLWASSAMALTVSEITQDLTCTCGCNMVVSACGGTMDCEPARKISKQVAQMIDSGKTKAEIMNYFVQTEGERILAAPTKKGFNLAAWILPFLAILFGGAGLYVFLNRCLSSRKDSAEATELSGAEADVEKKYLDQFDRELQSFDQ